MTEDHKPLPVAGYTAQPDAKVARVNGYKVLEERLLRELDKATVPKNDSGSLVYHRPSQQASETDQRWLAIARSHFEQGFMALNRSVFQPQRIALPEDDAK